MNVYTVTFKIDYGLFVVIVIANNEDNAKKLAYNALINKYYIYSTIDYTVDIKQLPVISEKDKEEILYINGYEE